MNNNSPIETLPRKSDSQPYLPEALRNRDQFVVTSSKSPIEPSNDWPIPDCQLSFDEAMRVARSEDGAVAFCFHEDDPFIGIDLDDVRTDDVLSDEVQSIISELNSYTEISQSGTGLHIIVEGELLPDRSHRGDLNGEGHIEMYDDKRYFVLTGATVGDTISVEARPNAVRDIQTQYLDPNDPCIETKGEISNDTRSQGQVSPEQIRKTICAYAQDDRYDTSMELIHLWRGQSSAFGGDDSAADMAFVCHLCFWCRRDPDLIDNCFRNSGRMRPKWDNVHYENGDTYGERTIQEALFSNKALDKNDQIFSGNYLNG